MINSSNVEHLLRILSRFVSEFTDPEKKIKKIESLLGTKLEPPRILVTFHNEGVVKITLDEIVDPKRTRSLKDVWLWQKQQEAEKNQFLENEVKNPTVSKISIPQIEIENSSEENEESQRKLDLLQEEYQKVLEAGDK
jgi:hypothetical protein